MTPFYADSWLEVWHGDCRAVMAEMEPESVHCVVTSPPYWGLRDYGTATWKGGDAGCAHVGSDPQVVDNRTRAALPNRLGLERGHGRAEGSRSSVVSTGDCVMCGATRIDAQLGLEPTPEEYVANLVAVFRDVRRVLRKDGTVWLNLGDSYAAAASSPGANTRGGLAKAAEKADGRPRNPANRRDVDRGVMFPDRHGHPTKPKDLVGIPWRVAFALQADGWYLRSDIIWSKPNPMPESVTDRPTKSHEYLFLLAKSARYYFDADAVREDHTSPFRRVPATDFVRDDKYGDDGKAIDARRRGSALSDAYAGGAPGNPAGRNIRSVWTVATAPYPGAHFATFPPKLIEPCIKAGSPNGGTVLDPFAGSGTTGMVAQSLSRRAVLIDLSLDYLGQLMDRNADIPLGLGA